MIIVPKTQIDPAELSEKFQALAPWITRFDIQGFHYGGSIDIDTKGSISEFTLNFPHAKTVLELGSLEGACTFELASQPQINRVVAIEGRRHNIAKAQFIESLHGNGKIEWVLDNLETA